MPPRPLHHWKSLWLGLLILASLIGAWARSHSHSDGLRFYIAPGSLQYLSSSSGSLHLSSHPFRYSGTPPRPVTWQSSSLPQPPPWFPKPLHYFLSHPGGAYIASLSIAYWLITLLYLLTWLTFLTWRWRRIKHLPPHHELKEN